MVHARACVEAVLPYLTSPPSRAHMYQRVVLDEHARQHRGKWGWHGPPTLSPLPRIASPQPSPSALTRAASSFVPDSQQAA